MIDANTPVAAPIEKGFGAYVLGLAAAFLVLCVLFVQLVDPYGVSPISLRFEGVNAVKPERVNIDRIIKPYEVWAKEPATIFMGTSRIHQSIDPAVLDGTALAPAYNAAIPANNLAMNISHLEQYLKFNPNIKRVYAELFIYNFLGQPQNNAPQDTWAYVKMVSPLFFSVSALEDAFGTLLHNIGGDGDVYQIAPGGYFHYPAGHNAEASFSGFAKGIWELHPQDDGPLKLKEASFVRMKELVELGEANGVEVVFLATPYHAYMDYYFDFIGAWDILTEWLRRASAIAPIVSFSQPNTLVYEPVSSDMRYWWDPSHFSLDMGRMMQLSLIGQTPHDLPANFLVRLTSDEIDAHIAERRAAIRAWAEENPAIVEDIQSGYRFWRRAREEEGLIGAETPPPLLSKAPPPTTPPTDIRPQFAGAVEAATLEGGFIRIAGWAANIPRNEPAPYVLVTDGDRVLAVVEPSLERPVIRDNLASNADPAGFEVAFEAPRGEAGTGAPVGGLKVYAIFWNGAAARLNVSLPGEAGALFERYAAGG